MKNLNFWVRQYCSISAKNKSASRLFIRFTGLVFLFIGFSACGPIPEETAHQKALKDSAEADSIMNIEANKIKSYERARKKHEDSLKQVMALRSISKKDSLPDSNLVSSNLKKPLVLSKKDSLAHLKKPKSDSLSKAKKHRSDSILKRRKFLSDTSRLLKKLHRDSTN